MPLDDSKGYSGQKVIKKYKQHKPNSDYLLERHNKMYIAKSCNIPKIDVEAIA